MTRRAKTCMTINKGNPYERWEFDNGEPELVNSWPTMDCINRAIDSSDARHLKVALRDLATLIWHPMGTEAAVARLRDLRKAYRGGFEEMEGLSND